MTTPSGDIFVMRDENDWVALQPRPFALERDFQDLLASHPELLLAGSGGRDLLLIRREVPIRHGEDGATGWLDHLFVDSDGVPTLVEVKRGGDSRVRREVVGQMLDYAANAAFGWPVERLQDFFSDTCKASGVQSDERLAEFLNGKDHEEFWTETKTNLQAGKLRLLFVADEIPSDLRRIIEFLNQQADPMEVLGVEVRQFVGEGVRTLLPRVVGRTEEAAGRKAVGTQVKWDERSYFERMAQVRPPQEIDAVRRLLDWATRSCTRVWWGEGASEPSFVPQEIVGAVKHQVFSAYGGTERSQACVYLYFQHHAAKPGFDTEERRRELLARFNAIPGVDLAPDVINRRPRINVAELSSDSLESLLGVFDWYLGEIRKTGYADESG